MLQLFTHGCIVAGMGSHFCLSVFHAVTGKRHELSTPNLVHVYSIAVARHAGSQRSKGQRSRSHGYKNRQKTSLLLCLFVHALKGKWLELLTPKLVHIYSIAVARHASTQKSKGQRTRSHSTKTVMAHGC